MRVINGDHPEEALSLNALSPIVVYKTKGSFELGDPSCTVMELVGCCTHKTPPNTADPHRHLWEV